MATLKEIIVRMVTRQTSTQVMRKLIKESPEVVTIGFYKECRKKGVFLHSRWGNYPVLPDSSSGDKL